MSHYHQYAQQQHQPQHSQQAMNYYNSLQVPVMLGMSTAQSNSIDYIHGLGLDINNNSTIINVRRDSGYANSNSLDEISVGIMSPSSPSPSRQQELKEKAAPSLPSVRIQSNISQFDSGSNSNPSFLLSPPTSSQSGESVSSPSVTSEVEGATPIVPSMSFGMGYIVAGEQQQQQRSFINQHHQSSPPSHYAYPSNTFQGQNQSPAVSSWSVTNPLYSANSMMNTVFDFHQQHQQQQLSLAIATSPQLKHPFDQQQALMSPLQYRPRDTQAQRNRQRKPHLQITTESDSSTAPFQPSSDNLQWDSAAYISTQSASVPLPLSVASPSISAANSIVRNGQQAYSWGLASSPVDSSFSSGTSTPVFASPSSSYAHSDLAASCESSRATSPSYLHSLSSDNKGSECNVRRMGSNVSDLTRSRKYSTSSSSSMGSQGRVSHLRESSTCSVSSTATQSISTPISTSTSSNQCPKCGQCFAGPAVLVRHIESIHDKLLWNCGGCKSNLSRRDAVTRHINLSPMDSVCRTVGTIGQIKISNGVEAHYEVSAYRAKPLDEVMSRMGKKISTALRREIDRSKAAMMQREATVSAAAAAAAANAASMTSNINDHMIMSMMSVADGLHILDNEECFFDDRKRRRSDLDDARRKK
ncbi:hypothetical protein KVV02_005663 [Mortierella alpina]|uniref:C2H2-type domain-containing protein n=1 Tax=Mortierella alpina TaxID=64518 RepID=A0A9P8A7I2_MORAP|nr:hypothetical protein KVV02_005663 [Mortierella alpina]